MLSGHELDSLALWSDSNGDGVSDPGEVAPLAAFGITRLGCAPQKHPSGILWNPEGVQFRDGRHRPTYDWIAETFCTTALTE